MTDFKIKGVNIDHYSCIAVPNAGNHLGKEYMGLALVSFCPKQWVEPVIKQDCEMQAADGDVIASLPVQGDSGAIYKNIFCAICHGVEAKNLTKWKTYAINGRFATKPLPTRRVPVGGTPTGRYIF